MRTIIIAFLLLLTIACAGCVSAKVYFDPKLPTVTDTELPKWKRRHPVTLVVEYEVNGVPDPKVAKRSIPQIARAIEATKLFDVKRKASSSFIVKVSENLDEKDVYAKAKMAAETFGKAGSIAQSHLSYVVRYVDGPSSFEKSSDLTMNVVLGNRSVPDDYEPMSIQRAQVALLERTVRSFLRDANQSGTFKHAEK